MNIMRETYLDLPSRLEDTFPEIDKKTHYVTNFLKTKVFSINSINLIFLEVYVMILSERRCFLYAKNNITKT